MKNRSAILLLFSANIISGFAQGITMIAIPWYFVNMVREASLFGVIYGGVTFATLFWGLYTGTLIDKYNRKNIFMITSLCGGIILVISSGVGYFSGQIPLFFAGLVFAATFLIYSIHYPTLYAFAHEISEPKDYARITSLIEIMGQTTNMISGALATILLAGGTGEGMGGEWLVEIFPFAARRWELHEVFLLDGITYILAIGLIAFIRFKPIAVRKPESGTIWERFITGYNFLKKYPLILIFGTSSFSVFVTIMIVGYQVVPLYIDKWLGRGADVFAASEIFFAGGAVLAGIVTTTLFRGRSAVIAVIIMSVVAALTYFAGSLNSYVPLFYFLYFILGLSNASVRIMRITHLFHLIPNYIFGRTGGVFGVINLILRFSFIGLFSLPLFAENKNVIFSFPILGLFILFSIIPLMLFYGKLNSFKPPQSEQGKDDYESGMQV
ncbi:MAG: MFS transporter [Bacteroidetes bacterium]|nr:MFS transporter [Bacteroidota bacterium]